MFIDQGVNAKQYRWPCKVSVLVKSNTIQKKDIDGPYLLRVTMMSIESTMPDELAPSVNVELVK
jgi:hypothetical protein